MRWWWCAWLALAVRSSYGSEEEEANEQAIEWPADVEWPDAQEWLVLVPGSVKAEDEDVCQDRLAQAKVVAEEFCKQQELEQEECKQVEEDVVKFSKEHADGEGALLRLKLDYSFSVQVKLRSDEEPNAELGLSPGSDIVQKVQEFCLDKKIKRESCEGLLKQTYQNWVGRRVKVLKHMGVRLNLAGVALDRVEKGVYTFADIVLAAHHAESVIKVLPKEWRAEFMLGGILAQASSREDVAAHLNKKLQGSDFMKASLDSYRRSLELHQEKHPLDDVEQVEVTVLTERLAVLRVVGQGYFQLGQVEEARSFLNLSLERAIGIRESMVAAGLSDNVTKALEGQIMTSGLELAVLHANLDDTDAVEATLAKVLGIPAFGELVRIPLELFSALLFPVVYASDTEPASAWRRSSKLLGELKSRLAHEQVQQQSVSILHPYIGFYSIYAGAPLGASSERDFRNKLSSVHQLASPNTLGFVSPALLPGPSPGGQQQPLRRVGFVSRYFYDHSLGKLMCNTIEELTKQFNTHQEGQGEVQVFAIQLGQRALLEHQPGVCRSLATMPSFLLLDIPPATDAGNATKTAFIAVAGLELDILVFVDGSLDAYSYFFTFGRMAPIQVAFWGHPITTGEKTQVDYAITSSKFFPFPHTSGHIPGSGTKYGVPWCSSDTHELGNNNFVPFSEQLICFNGLGTFFIRPGQVSIKHLSDAQSALEEAFASQENLASVDVQDANIYFLPHKVMKIHPIMDSHLIGILEKDPKAVLLFLIGDGTKSSEKAFSVFALAKQKLEARLRAQKPDARIAWLKPLPKQVFLGVGQLAAATLEAFGSFGSGVTALELVSAGVPMVSFPSQLAVAPNVHGIYNLLATRKKEWWIAEELSCTSMDKDDPCFVDKSIKLATDHEFKQKWQDLLLEARSSLFSDNKVTTEWMRLLVGLHIGTLAKFHYDLDTRDKDIRDKLAVFMVANTSVEDESDLVMGQLLNKLTNKMFDLPPSESEGEEEEEEKNDADAFEPHLMQLKDRIRF